jgi:predicted RNA-binding Zn ribbon-like protein
MTNQRNRSSVGDQECAPRRRKTTATPENPASVTATSCLRVRFDEDGGPTLGPESSGVSAALGRILAAVVRATDEGIWGRLKVCTNDPCQSAFYDCSRNRSGKWCTMEVCGNRMKARAFRQRQGTGEG